MMGKRRSKNTPGNPMPIQVQLLRPVEDIANLVPANQILAVENRYARVIGKGGENEVIVIAYPANSGVRVKTCHNGVEVLLFVLCNSGRVQQPKATGKHQECFFQTIRNQIHVHL